jgi:putative FmdB family regulatory protein
MLSYCGAVFCRRDSAVPIYEYECEVCNHRFEVMQKFSDKPIKKCTQCAGPVHKVLSPPALVFKGTGWYVTDYARSDKGKGKEKKADGDSKDSGGTSSASATQTPAAASSTAKSD